MIKYVVCVEKNWQYGFKKGASVSADDAMNIYFSQDDLNYRQIAIFDTEAEAIECLNKQKISTVILDAYVPVKKHGVLQDAIICADIAFIEVVDFDKDEDAEGDNELDKWEFIEGSDYAHFRFEEI